MTDPNRYRDPLSGEAQADLDTQLPFSGMPNAAQPPIQVESQEDQDIAALHSAEADLYNEQRKQESGAAQLAAMRRASSMTPDYAAYCDKLSTDLDVPFNAVTHDKEAARKEADVPAWESIARFAPKTSALLQEKPEVFHQVQDDAAALKDLEVFKSELKKNGVTDDEYNAATKTIFDPAESIKAELSRSLETGERYAMPSRSKSSFFTNLDAIGTQFTESAIQSMDIGARSVLNDAKRGLGITGYYEARDIQDQLAREYNESAFRSAQATPDFSDSLLPKTNEFMFGAASSFAQSAPLMFGGVGLKVLGVPLKIASALTLSGMFGQQSLLAYPKYRSRGGDAGESALGSLLEGSFEVAFEKSPIGFAMEELGKMSVKNFAKHFASKDAIGEQGATFFQDLTDTLIANPNKTMAEFWQERPEAAVQTMFAVGMNTAAMASVQHIANTVMKYDGSYEANQKLNQEMEIVKKLKVAGLNTIRAKQIIDNMDGDSPQDVYVDPQQLFNQGEISPQQFKNAMPNYSAQLDEALAVGGLLRMDKNELMLAMRNDEEGWASLSQHLKVDPAADSLYESAQSRDALTDELNKLADKRIAESKNEAEARDQWEALKEKARQRLANSGMDKEAIEQAATMDASVAHAFSTRTGLDAGDILSGQFGTVSRRLSGGEILGGVFNQSRQDELDEIDFFESAGIYSKDEAATLRAKIQKDGGRDESRYDENGYRITARDEAGAYLSHFPATTEIHGEESAGIRRIRQSSDRITNELQRAEGKPQEVHRTVPDRPLGPFSSYVVNAKTYDHPTDPKQGQLEIRYYGKEQMDAGLTDEPALTVIIGKDGEFGINGPSPESETFKAFKERGWAEEAKQKDGVINKEHTRLINPHRDDGQFSPSQVKDILADAHARLRAWRKEDRVGLNWGRATGATGGEFGNEGAAFFQSQNAKPFDGKEVAKTKLPEGATHIDVDGVSHPALNSNGQPIHWSEEGTRNFWRWFGDSKAVDTDGRPLVLYHGPSTDFTVFDPDKGKGKTADTGVHLTTSEDVARTYSKQAPMALYLKASAPVEVQANGAAWSRLGAKVKLSAPKGKTKAVKGTLSKLFPKEFLYDDFFSTDDLSRWTRSEGFDSIVFHDIVDRGPVGANATARASEPADLWVTFKGGSNIKSATDNSGAFDGSNPNFLHQNKQDPRGTFDPVTRAITLMPDSDLSTYLHESGHLYLEVMASLAAHETASEGLRADMDAALKWFGVKGENASERLAAWNAMTLEEKRNFHEKWAESFEQYLFEGVAPSPELREAFKNFRQWLTHVYKSMAQFLVGQKNAKLNDEMRGVFDRMLASEEQINTMREARNMLPIFTVRPANITNDEWERYQQAAKDFVEESIEQLTSRSLRDMKWLSNAKNKTLRKLQMEAAHARREARMEAITTALGQPVYRAWQFLTAPVEGVVARNKQARSSEHVDTARDSLFTAIAKLGGLNKEEAVSQYGIDPKDFLRKGGVFGKPVLRVDGGLSPDAMAEALAQHNYLPLDEHGKWDILDLEDLLREEAAGNPQYSTDVDMDVLLGEPQRAFFDAENVEYMGGRLNRIDIRNMFDDIQLAEMAGIDPYTGEAVATEPQQEGDAGLQGYMQSEISEGDDDALRKEFTDTEKAYGGEAAYEKAKADGKTKLNYRQWVQVRTPRFKEWFGDWENDPANASKGIDQDTGEPLVVYHGTDATRTVFDRKHLGRSSGRGTGTDWGFFFAKDRDHAEYWANNAGGDRVVESVYLRIENPLVIEDSGNDGGATLDRILDERLQDSDHDGAIIHGMQDDDSGELRTAYLVFDSEQIKSAIGNSGAFDGSNPNILRQNKKNKDTDLFVAHNLSEENLIHADELGGLAAPSLGVSRTTTGGFDGFGGITLLADKEILTDRYARTFDADVYSPRHPRAQENISYGNYIDLVQRIKENQGEVQGLEFRVDHDSLMRNGANDLANSEAFQNYYLVSKGIIIKPKKAKAAPAILNAIKYLKKNAKHDSAYAAYNLRNEDWFKSLAEEHYKAEFEKWKNLRDDFTPAELVKYGPFEEDGSLKHGLYNRLALEVEHYHRKGGQDSAATRGAIAKHFRTDKGSTELQEFARAELAKISSGKQLVKYTKNGNQKRSAYTLENIVAEMTRELRGGEGFNYGAGSVRSAFAFEFKHNTIESIKSHKKNIVSKQEMDKVRDDANNKLSEALDRLAKFYKYDSTSWGYTNDASSAIAEGPKGWSSAFKMTTESKKIITDLVTYLSNLPSEYFETKMQRAVGIGEFKTAVVPKGISAKAMAILEKNGLNVVTYDPKKEGSRTAVIAKQEDILFQKKGKDSKPKNRTLESMGVLSDDGIHPDLLADYFGFPSVEAMVKALLTAPDPLSEINRLTDEIMVQRYADLATPQAIEQAALAALHSEAHSKFLATELAILNRAVGKPRLVMQAAKQYADRIVYALRIADLNPAQYEMQAAKAGKETEKLLGQNKTADAAMAKRNQILHDATARRVREEKESVAKALRFFDRTEKAARNGKLRADVGAQVLTLLDTYDLRKGTTLKAAELADRSLAEFVQQQSEAMDMPMPSLADAVLRGVVKRSYKTMSVEEFNGLVDAVKYLEAVGRREYAMYKAVRDQSFAQERSAILERLREYWPDAFDEEGNPLPTENAILKTGAYNTKKKARSAVHELLTPETVTNILEGGEFGQVHDSLFARLSNAMTDRSILMKELHEKLQPFMDAYTWKERREFGKKDIGTAAIGEPLSRENALVAALLAGSKEGRDRLANYGWNDARIAQVVNLLDAKDIALANAIFDMFDNTLWPKLEALNKRTMGVSPPKVLPIALQAKNGTLTGGYFPIRYDGDMDARSSSFDDKQALDLMKNGIGLSAKTNQSSSQARVDGVKMRPLLSLSVMSRVAGETAHDISLREAVMDSARLLNNAEIAQGIQNIVGMEGWKSLKKNLGDIASPPHDAGGMFAGAANFARRNVVTALMSGVGTAVQNFTGLLPAFSRVHKGLLLKEIADVPHLIEKYKDTIEKSAYMRERFGQFERDLVNDVDKLGMKKGLMPDQSVWFAMMAWVDRAVSVPVWQAAYREGAAKGVDAVEYADHIVRQTQGGGRLIDRAPIMRGGALQQLFTMFYSYFNGQLNMVARDAALAKREVAQGEVSKAAARLAASAIFVWILPAVVSELTRQAPDDEDDEDKLKRVVRATILYPTAMIPLLRDFAPFVYDKIAGNRAFDPRLTPVQGFVSTLSRAATAAGDIGSDDFDEKDFKALMMGVGFTFNLPAILFTDVVLGTKALLDGETDDIRAPLIGTAPSR